MSYYQFYYDENECLFELKNTYNKSMPLCQGIKKWIESASWPRKLPSRINVEQIVNNANYIICQETSNFKKYIICQETSNFKKYIICHTILSKCGFMSLSEKIIHHLA